MYSCAIFRTLAYLEPEASSKAYQTLKNDHMYIQSLGIARTVYSSIFKDFQMASLAKWLSDCLQIKRLWVRIPLLSYLGIFRDIDAYSATLIGAQLGRRGDASPALFEN